jgi:hypothetical protein
MHGLKTTQVKNMFKRLAQIAFSSLIGLAISTPILAQSAPIVILGETSEGDTLAYSTSSLVDSGDNGTTFTYYIYKKETGKVRRVSAYTPYCVSGFLHIQSPKFFESLPTLGWFVADKDDYDLDEAIPVVATSKASILLLELACDFGKYK